MDAAVTPVIRAEPCPRCHLCGHDGEPAYVGLRDHLFGAFGTWNLRRCPNPTCGLVWLDPMPLAEEIGKAYKTYYTHADNSSPARPLVLRLGKWVGEGYLARRYGYRKKGLTRLQEGLGWLIYLHPAVRAILDFSVLYLRQVPAGRLLDVGCGGGNILAAMAARGWRVEGVDTDPAAVENARGKGLTVHYGKVDEQHFPPACFDAIVMSHVIEHVPSPIDLVRSCHLLLKPKGVLVIITPNSQSWGHERYGRFWRGLEPPRHLHIFNPHAMRRLATNAGFGDYKVSTTIRDADSLFLASDRLRRIATGHTTGRAPHFLAQVRARLMQMFEWALLKVRPESGEEIVAAMLK